MDKRVLRTINEHNMLRNGDNLVVALSGGADSVSLLHIMLSLRDTLGINVMAAHVNHKLRGEESDRDERFVCELCKKYSVELFVHTADVSALADECGESIELCGRRVRYEFFGKLSAEHSAKIATAHTLSDCEETMLYNIARGAALHGLCSIPYTRDNIVRPLLDVTREQVEEYCSSNSLSFVQDSTNFSEDVCKRNKLRLSVLPHLREVNDGFDSNFSRLRKQLILVDNFMSQTAAKALEDATCDFGLSADKLRNLDEAVLGYALMQYISTAGATAEYRHIELCQQILSAGGAVNLPCGFTALCTQGVFRIVKNTSDKSNLEMPLEVPLSFCREDTLYSVEELSREDIVNRKLAPFCLSYDIVKSGAVIRTRREGDTFTLVRRNITKPLRKLQNELGIPAERRTDALVIACGSTVLWAEHIGVSLQGALPKEYEKGIYIKILRG